MFYVNELQGKSNMKKLMIGVIILSVLYLLLFKIFKRNSPTPHVSADKLTETTNTI